MLLNYELRSVPSPLTASSLSGDSDPAELLVVVTLPPPTESGPTPPVTCTRFALQFTMGLGETDLIAPADFPSLSVDFVTEGWSATLSQGATTCTVSVTSPAGVDFDARTAVAVRLAGIKVNQQVGVCPVRVVEFSAPAGGSQSSTRAEENLFLAKFPHAYVFRDFLGDDPMVEYGKTTMLRWAGEAGTYTLSMNGGSARPLTDAEATSRTIVTPPLQETTVFTLTVTAGSAPWTVQASMRTMVMVSRPWLRVTGLVVERESVDGQPGDGFMRVRGQTTFQNGFSLEMDAAASCTPTDTTLFQGRTLPRNAAGWFLSDDTCQLEKWVMATGAVRLVVDGTEGLSVAGAGNVTVPGLPELDGRAVHPLYCDAVTGQLLQGPQAGSTERVKQDIRPLLADFHALLDVRPVEFTYRASGERSVGFLAENLEEKGMSHLVHHDCQGRPIDVAYDKLGLWLLEIVRDQQRRIEMLEAERN